MGANRRCEIQSIKVFSSPAFRNYVENRDVGSVIHELAGWTSDNRSQNSMAQSTIEPNGGNAPATAEFDSDT